MNIIVTIILIIVFFLFGQIFESIKKTFALLVDICMKILALFGVKIELHEKTIHLTKEFKSVYKDIKTMKLSKKNIKQKSSIDWFYFVVFIVSASLAIINLQGISGNAISKWLFHLLNFTALIGNEIDANTLFTAMTFSILSFSITKIATRWKETKQQRKEKRELKKKYRVVSKMSSKELLDMAREIDARNYKESLK